MISNVRSITVRPDQHTLLTSDDNWIAFAETYSSTNTEVTFFQGAHKVAPEGNRLSLFHRYLAKIRLDHIAEGADSFFQVTTCHVVKLQVGKVKLVITNDLSQVIFGNVSYEII